MAKKWSEIKHIVREKDMASVNKPINELSGTTHGGSPARSHTALQELKRTVMSCMLWEDTFYESGKSVADRISELIPKVDPKEVSQLAIDAREKSFLRHVPLLVVREMAKHPAYKPYVQSTLSRVIQRPDELTEFVAIYWKDKKQPLAASVKRGLADAFQKFSAYSLGKYNNQDQPIKLRDVLFLSHAKPKDEEQAGVWKRLVDKTLETPDTWEVALSASKGEGKKEVWERLLEENKLGSLALLRNLRNMDQCNVDPKLVRAALSKCKAEKVLPFRFITAAKAAPKLEDELNQLMLRCCAEIPKLKGETILIVDVSGSMSSPKVSQKSEVTRLQAAAALASLVREVCESAEIYATGGNDGARRHATALVPNRRGLPLIAGVLEMLHTLGGGGIFVKQVLDWVWAERKGRPADRVIIITDEQDCDTSPNKDAMKFRQIAPLQYMLNVNGYKNGISYGPWTRIDGWSERAIDFIRESEEFNQ